jgi:Arc/MetJ-type ribon-helix-helix transcriptional regulator
MSNTAIINDRLRFLEIDEAVIEELRKARELLAPELDRMLDQFYSHVSDEPQLRELFDNDKSMAKARAAQKLHWLESLLTGEFTDDYCRRTERIGHAHARAGLTPNWYIGGYSTMLTQFIQHILASRSGDQHSASPVIEALCKAVMLDVDLVIHSYLEAKDRLIFDLLLHATRFIDDLTARNDELRSVSEAIRNSVEALAKDPVNGEQSSETLEQLQAKTTKLADGLKDLDERIDALKSGNRLYLKKGSEHTGTFSQLVTQIIDL